MSFCCTQTSSKAKAKKSMEYSDLEIMDNKVDRPGGQHQLTVTCRLVVALLFVGVVVMVMSVYTVVIISDTHHTGQSGIYLQIFI